MDSVGIFRPGVYFKRPSCHNLLVLCGVISLPDHFLWFGRYRVL